MLYVESDPLVSEESETSIDTEKDGKSVTAEKASIRLLSVWLVAGTPPEMSSTLEMSSALIKFL